MRRIAALLVLGLAASVHAQDAPKVTLEWKFAKGETLRYEIREEATYGVAGMDYATESIFTIAMEPTEVADGVATLKITIERILFKISGVMDVDYDSDRDEKAPDDAMGEVLSKIVGKSFTMKMDRRGTVLAVSGLEKMVKDALGDADGDEEGDPMGLAEWFSDEHTKWWLQQSLAKLPEKAVGAGDTWDEKATVPMPQMGNVEMASKSKLKEIRGKEAVIAQDVKFEPTKSGEGESEMSITDGKATAELVWLLDSGRLHSLKSVTTMNASAGGVEVAMKTTTTVKPAPERKAKKKDY